jgi:DNA-binding SARP family transcriptional activator
MGPDITTTRAAVQLDLMGGFRLCVAGDEVAVPTAAQRVIAFVALQNRPVRRSRLAGSIWLDKPDERAGGNLRSALWRLRKQGADVMDLDDGVARLRDDVEVDVHEATAWAWRVIDGRGERGDLEVTPPMGELLIDWYDDWVLLERERLHQLRLHALEGVCRTLISDLRMARAIDAALAVVAADPLRESGYRLLIESHLGEGNVSEALRVRRDYMSVMREQLGIDADHRLDDLLPV